jgi:hnRNP-L/PTB/hephaestus splicing factor
MDIRRQKRERDSDLSSPPPEDAPGMFGGDSNDSKKAKTDASGPSRVIHIRNIVAGVSEAEVIQLALPFGKVTNILMMKQKNQAFVEFESDGCAQTMVSFFQKSAQPMLGGRNVFIQFSQHKELKTDSAHSIANEKAQAALQACQNGGAGLMSMDSGGEGLASTGQEAVLHVTIENMVYPVTLETLAIIFKKYGGVQKILTFTKNNKFQVWYFEL